MTPKEVNNKPDDMQDEKMFGESEQRFKILSEATFEGITLSENGIIIDLNDQHARMHGYERNELIGKPIMEIVALESRERLAEVIRLKEKGPIEYIDLRKDGTTFPVEVRSSIVRIGNRELHLSAVRDISERKQADILLQRERNLLKILIDNLPVLVYIKDAEGRYVLNNLPHLRSIGAEHQQDVLGKTTFDFNPPDLAKGYHEDEMRIVQTGQALIGKEEIALNRETGKMCWHLTSKIPLKDSEGKVTGFVCISSDISDRKQAEKTLYHERNLLRTLIDNLPDLIFFKDTEGRYILDNRAHFRSLGVERQEDIIGKTTFDFNPPELAQRYHEDEMKIVQTGKALLEKEELALHRDTGEKRWHLTSKIPLVDNLGRVTGIVGIARDITERRLAEEERERLINELQSALADVNTLSGLVPICAHCKKIRDDKGYWTQIESYIQEHSDASFSHGICPECKDRFFSKYCSKK